MVGQTPWHLNEMKHCGDIMYTVISDMNKQFVSKQIYCPHQGLAFTHHSAHIMNLNIT